MNRRKGIRARNSGKEINQDGQTEQMKEEIGEIEDATKYGEFVSSYFTWISPEIQKQKAKELEDITKEEE